MESSSAGKILELEVAQNLIHKGYRVCWPLLNERYDIVAEKYPVYIRIQVKPMRKVIDANIDKWKINTDLIWAIDINLKDYAIIPVENAPGCVTYISTNERNEKREYLNSFKALYDLEKKVIGT